MEELFNILSSSARIDKSKRKKNDKKNKKTQWKPDDDDDDDDVEADVVLDQDDYDEKEEDDDDYDVDSSEEEEGEDVKQQQQQRVVTSKKMKSRDKTGKRDMSIEKLNQVHKEKMSAFRRSMSIYIANKNDPYIPDPVSSFHEICQPKWWKEHDEDDDDDHHDNNSNKQQQQQQKGIVFHGLHRTILRNIEGGRWKEPTPIQMQSIPTLMNKRDCISCAPTGSGKSGAFILPALFLSSTPHHVFYSTTTTTTKQKQIDDQNSKKTKKKKKKKDKIQNASAAGNNGHGEIRALLLAPSLELASQLHREVERLGTGKPGGLTSLLLSKSNVKHVLDGTAGGKKGLDILVATPLRLVDIIEKGLRLNTIRIVVLDEADRLLDAADGSTTTKVSNNKHDDDKDKKKPAVASSSSSGSTQTKTFLEQMDVILNEIPTSATRALFSATITPTVRTLAESVLRNPIDITIRTGGAGNNNVGGANPDIQQELMFVGREDGKLLAIRQLVQRGQLRPPVLIFLQSQERAQALFAELLYDGIHVDVIHSGRSKSAREATVAKFRRGDTWVLICTDLVGRGVDFRAVNMVINYDLPTSGISYTHRIGRTGRAGRKGRAITLFTESDFDNLRTIANVMKQSGCHVEDWMLNMSRKKQHGSRKNRLVPRRRQQIDTTPSYDKAKKRKKTTDGSTVEVKKEKD